LHDKLSRAPTTATPHDRTFASSKPPPAVVSVIGCSADAIGTVGRDLQGILQNLLIEREVDVEDLSRLDGRELEAVQAKVRAFGISLEYRRHEGGNGNQAGNAARSRAGSRREVCVLTGLNEDVLGVIELINGAIRKGLCQDLRDKEEAGLALSVQWSMQDANKAWHELSLHDNYMLEEAHRREQGSVELAPTGGGRLNVNLTAQEATDCLTRNTFRVKRNESEMGLSHVVV